MYLRGSQLSTNEPRAGFILSRNAIERSGKTFLEFWLSTDAGPAKVTTQAQPSVLFVAQSDLANVQRLSSEAGLRLRTKSLQLRTFSLQSVSALYLDSLNDFYRLRDLLRVATIDCYEADIRPADRFLMERFIHAGVEFVGQDNNSQGQKSTGFLSVRQAKLKASQYQPSLHWLSIDIECSEFGELFSIGFSAGQFKQVIMIREPQPSEEWIRWAESEKHLLQMTVELITKRDPDLIIGWNLINFDFSVLVERARHHHVALTLGRDGSSIAWQAAKPASNQAFVRIAGRVVIDGIDGLKTATHHFDSFALEFVAQSLLGVGKDTDDVDNRLTSIQHDFIHNKVKLANYNIQDCVLVEQIFEKTKLLDYLILRSQITGLELDRIGGSVAAFVHLYLPKLHRAGYVSPNRPDDGGLASPGGYVMDSFPGLYKHVLVLDFKSLYPSIIRTFKVDPLGLIEGLQHPDDAIPGFRGALFSRDKHFLPEIISSLWAQRDEAKKQHDLARSQAIKILMNSFYGVLGSGGCPFYDTRLASSITLRGHQIMQTTAKWIEEMGYKVIYGDTDSTFVWLENVQETEQARSIGQRIEQQINSNWRSKLRDELALECQLEIEFETLFETFLMPTIRGAQTGSKKRYAGRAVKQDGQLELIFKGLETVRSDWTGLAKSFQRQLYQMVFEQQDVISFVHSTIADIYAGKVDNELVYRKRLRQPLMAYTKNVPPHVRAARMADQLNANHNKPLKYQNKGWVSYVITMDGPQPIEYVSSRLDYQHYVDKQIKPIAEGILPFIHLSFEQIVSQQLGLFH